MTYSLLSELDTNRDDWTVMVRVYRTWEFINFKRSHQLISLDLILMDEKKTLMHTVIWKNQVNRFRDKFSEGSVIIIRNFKVTDSTGEYRPVSSNFKITFLQKNLNDFNSNTLCSSVYVCSSVKSKITLWEEFGETFYPYLYKTESEPYIVIVTSTTLKEFRGEVTFATTAASKIYVNLKIDYITSLIQRFANTSVGVQTIVRNNTNNISIEEEMFQNRMTITELLDSDWSADIQECTVTLRAQVAEIDNYFDWYKIHVKVKDAHGQTTLVLFNVVAEKLLDTSASKLVNRFSSC
ncbi:hypothetical protein HAX54_016965 [Datura stramonium]|uniref:Replication protein A 70 kDa DNA-binding subunit B/D first OB fold domain-containing protein n=1 Tax=Datura stramonium TaxID=4076 RepID=A0ABS8ULF9_DATST|nr:hypothetical protein [Datura stramonium]